MRPEGSLQLSYPEPCKCGALDCPRCRPMTYKQYVSEMAEEFHGFRYEEDYVSYEADEPKYEDDDG